MVADACTGFSEMADLLEEERRILVGGRLTDLPDIALRKDRLMTRLEAIASADGEELREIRHALQRNQRLLASALEGIRAVSARLEELRRVDGGLTTYGRDGRRKKVATNARPKLEKRA